jgi:hypothetical protein
MENQPEIPEYLRSAPTGSVAGFENVTSRDLTLLRDLDFSAQLMAIRLVLSRHQQSEKELSDEIAQIEEVIRRKPGERSADEWVDLLHHSVYQRSAHSMAAVGMFAPLTESMFSDAFGFIRENFVLLGNCYENHPRWKLELDRQWDCHFYRNDKGKPQKSVYEGIVQLAEAVGLTPHLPENFKPTLQALFEYRNKMFHHGLEWPVRERKKFAARINRGVCNDGWSADWFDKSTSGEEPWIFYLTDAFIIHFLEYIDQINDGMGAYLFQRTR